MALNSEPATIREQIAHQLGQQLLDAYCCGLFGKVSKQEIEVMVFSAAVKSFFCDHFEFWEQDHSMRWLRLGAGELIPISTHLRLTKARVQALVEQAYALKQKQELTPQDVINEFLVLLKRSEASADLNAPGLIRLQVPNRAIRLALEGFFVSSGCIVDGSFNHDLLILGMADVLAALTKHAANQQELIKQLAAAAEQHLPNDQALTLREESAFNKPQKLRSKIGDLAIQTTTQAATRWTVTHCLTWLAQHWGAQA